MNEYLGSARRRHFLGAAGVTALGSVFGGMLVGIKPARAQSLSGPVPEVDRLAIRVVTDSYHHAFEASRKVGDMQMERVGFPFTKEPPKKVLQNEWGLSLHLESSRGGDVRQILIDFGFTPE